MLGLMGSEYVIEHCVAEHNIRINQKAYQIYTTDLLKAIAETNGVEVYRRFADFISPTQEDKRTGDEIALDIIKRAGLKVKEDEAC